MKLCESTAAAVHRYNSCVPPVERSQPSKKIVKERYNFALGGTVLQLLLLPLKLLLVLLPLVLLLLLLLLLQFYARPACQW